MESLTAGNLTIEIAEKPERIVMKWLGKSDERDPSALISPFLDEIGKQIDSRSILVEFQKLEYMNSSTVPPIIQFMKNLSDLKIETTFTYDKSSNWQAASFKALETISRSLNSVKVEGI